MTLNIFRKRHDHSSFLCIFLCVISGLLVSLNTWSAFSQQAGCVSQKGNEYEKIFCQLKRKGKGNTLPAFEDFKQNSPLIQALLLKKPAERAGITLKIPQRKNKETVRRQERLLAVDKAVVTQLVSKPESRPEKPLLIKPKQKTQKPNPQPKKTEAKQHASRQLVRKSVDFEKNCRLENLELHCLTSRYRLVTNQVNQRLDRGVLQESHRLNLPEQPSLESESSSNIRDEYLKKSYHRYLQGMMEIGLGASTLSYTKFVRLYDHINQHELNFVERFETMYGFLKKDKVSIGVSTQAVVAANFTPQYCSELSTELLACEHGRDNYVFKKIY